MHHDSDSLPSFSLLIWWLHYFLQDEPAIITLDNMAKYLKQSHNSVGGSPDVFDVNVQAVIKTKDAPNASKKFYLSRI